jgi:hypothetical protein
MPTIFLRASYLSNPCNSWGTSPQAFILPFSSRIQIGLSPCLCPTSKSLGSCAGVILTAPVPKFLSTYSSAIIGISRPERGITTVFPTSSEYLSSSGWTAMATSPKIVSGLVVATIIAPCSPLRG